ncbi:toxin glutamine deamidase domain-containing protein [Streptacidiphilus griseoplanus]|uniref:toxin glutamine deamidase domain-containing protein n=1 Tax=Peterkaempfera griseoplana TaxID=66896 RepID=UPI0006E3A565|nr:toxin glutamine deamidase domain-containing protein [Peterkaempfera griseoplana]
MAAEFDVGPIRDLGNQWVEYAHRIYECLTSMHGSVASMATAWTGKTGRNVQFVWDSEGAGASAPFNVYNSIFQAAWVAEQLGNAILDYADELQKTIDQINRAHLVEALGTIFGTVLGIASFGIGGLLSQIGATVGRIVEAIMAIIGVAARAANLIGRAGAFLMDSVLNAGVTLGTDVASQVAAARAAGVPFVMDWQGEAINMGLSVWTNAWMGGVETHVLGGKSLDDGIGGVIDKYVFTPPKTDTPNLANTNIGGPSRVAIPDVTHLSPFPVNSVIEHNALPPMHAGTTNPVSGTPRATAGSAGGGIPRPGEVHVTEGAPTQAPGGTRPGTPTPGDVRVTAGDPTQAPGGTRPGGTALNPDAPVVPGRQLTNAGGGTPPNSVRDHTTPVTTRTTAHLDGPPRSAADGPGNVAGKPSGPDANTGGGRNVSTDAGAPDAVPATPAAGQHDSGVREYTSPGGTKYRTDRNGDTWIKESGDSTWAAVVPEPPKLRHDLPDSGTTPPASVAASAVGKPLAAAADAGHLAGGDRSGAGRGADVVEGAGTRSGGGLDSPGRAAGAGAGSAREPVPSPGRPVAHDAASGAEPPLSAGRAASDAPSGSVLRSGGPETPAAGRTAAPGAGAGHQGGLYGGGSSVAGPRSHAYSHLEGGGPSSVGRGADAVLGVEPSPGAGRSAVSDAGPGNLGRSGVPDVPDAVRTTPSDVSQSQRPAGGGVGGGRRAAGDAPIVEPVKAQPETISRRPVADSQDDHAKRRPNDTFFAMPTHPEAVEGLSLVTHSLASDASATPGISRHDVGSGSSVKPDETAPAHSQADAGSQGHGTDVVEGSVAHGHGSGPDGPAVRDTGDAGATGIHTRDDVAASGSGSGDTLRHEPAPVSPEDMTARNAQWDTFKQNQVERHAPVVEAESRLERSVDLDAVWQRGYDKFVKQNRVGELLGQGAQPPRDGHLVKGAQYGWRRAITHEFRNEVAQNGHISEGAYNRIVDGAEKNAYKHILRAHDIERFAAHFRQQADAYRNGGGRYGEFLPEYDRAPSRYVYDSKLQTYVKDDLKLYGQPEDTPSGPVGKLKGGRDGSDPDDFTFIEYKSDSDVPVDHFRDKAHDFNPLERDFIDRVDQLNEVYGKYIHDAKNDGGPSSGTQRELDRLWGGMQEKFDRIAQREHDIQAVVGRRVEDLIERHLEGGAETLISDTLTADSATRLRQDFLRDLRDQHDTWFPNGRAEPSDGFLTMNEHSDDLWVTIVDRAVDQFPVRIDREKFIQAAVESESGFADRFLSSQREDLLTSLGEDGRQRVLADYLDNARISAGRHFDLNLDPRRRTGDGPAEPWTTERDWLRSTLPDTVLHDARLQDVNVTDSAVGFNEVMSHDYGFGYTELRTETIDRLGNDFRVERVTRYDALYGPEGHRTDAWLAHAGDGTFRSNLDHVLSGSPFDVLPQRGATVHDALADPDGTPARAADDSGAGASGREQLMDVYRQVLQTSLLNQVRHELPEAMRGHVTAGQMGDAFRTLAGDGGPEAFVSLSDADQASAVATHLVAEQVQSRLPGTMRQDFSLDQVGDAYHAVLERHGKYVVDLMSPDEGVKVVADHLAGKGTDKLVSRVLKDHQAASAAAAAQAAQARDVRRHLPEALQRRITDAAIADAYSALAQRQGQPTLEDVPQVSPEAVAGHLVRAEVAAGVTRHLPEASRDDFSREQMDNAYTELVERHGQPLLDGMPLSDRAAAVADHLVGKDTDQVFAGVRRERGLGGYAHAGRRAALVEQVKDRLPEAVRGDFTATQVEDAHVSLVETHGQTAPDRLGSERWTEAVADHLVGRDTDQLFRRELGLGDYAQAGRRAALVEQVKGQLPEAVRDDFTATQVEDAHVDLVEAHGRFAPDHLNPAGWARAVADHLVGKDTDQLFAELHRDPVADAPTLAHAVDALLQRHTAFRFTREQVEQAVAELAEQHAEITDLPRRQLAVRVGLHLVEPMQQLAKATNQLLVKKYWGSGLEDSEIQRAHRELVDEFGAGFLELPVADQAGIVAVMTVTDRDVLRDVRSRMNTGGRLTQGHVTHVHRRLREEEGTSFWRLTFDARADALADRLVQLLQMAPKVNELLSALTGTEATFRQAADAHSHLLRHYGSEFTSLEPGAQIKAVADQVVRTRPVPHEEYETDFAGFNIEDLIANRTESKAKHKETDLEALTEPVHEAYRTQEARTAAAVAEARRTTVDKAAQAKAVEKAVRTEAARTAAVVEEARRQAREEAIRTESALRGFTSAEVEQALDIEQRYGLRRTVVGNDAKAAAQRQQRLNDLGRIAGELRGSGRTAAERLAGRLAGEWSRPGLLGGSPATATRSVDQAHATTVPATTVPATTVPATVHGTPEVLLSADPKAFLNANVLSMNMSAALEIHSPGVTAYDRSQFLEALDAKDLPEHRFVVVRQGEDTNGKPRYVLAPAVEWYVQQYGATELNLPEGLSLPAVRADGEYVNAVYVPYLTGTTRDYAQQVGHTAMLRRPGESDPRLVVTPTMNGCAYTLTRHQDPDKIKVWHYQSPDSNMPGPVQFRREQRPLDWFGVGEYANPKGEMFEVANLMWYGPGGWEFIGQENETTSTDTSVTFVRVRSRAAVMQPGREAKQIARAYQSLPRSELRDWELPQAMRNIAATKGQAADTAVLRQVWNRIERHLKGEIRQLRNVADKGQLREIPDKFEKERRALRGGLEDLIAQASAAAAPEAARSADVRRAVLERRQLAVDMVNQFIDKPAKNWINLLRSEAAPPSPKTLASTYALKAREELDGNYSTVNLEITRVLGLKSSNKMKDYLNALTETLREAIRSEIEALGKVDDLARLRALAAEIKTRRQELFVFEKARFQAETVKWSGKEQKEAKNFVGPIDTLLMALVQPRMDDWITDLQREAEALATGSAWQRLPLGEQLGLGDVAGQLPTAVREDGFLEVRVQEAYDELKSPARARPLDQRVNLVAHVLMGGKSATTDVDHDFVAKVNRRLPKERRVTLEGAQEAYRDLVASRGATFTGESRNSRIQDVAFHLSAGDTTLAPLAVPRSAKSADVVPEVSRPLGPQARRQVSDADRTEQLYAVAEPPHAQELVRELPLMSPQDRANVLNGLSLGHRRWLAQHAPLVDGLRAALPPREFAETAAALLVQVDARAHQPALARQEAQAQVFRMVQDPDVAARLLKNGSQVFVVPRDVSATDLPPFRQWSGVRAQDSAGQGRLYDDMRGLATEHAAVSEENLLGEDTTVGSSRALTDGYSSAVHEFAHVLHRLGITEKDRAAIKDSFDRRTDRPKASWPDGTNKVEKGVVTKSYSAQNEYEYFAQLTNVWLGANTGIDADTGKRRNNGDVWVRRHVPELVPLMERLFGKDPSALYRGSANPVTATRADNAMYDGFRDFMQQTDAPQGRARRFPPPPEGVKVPGVQHLEGRSLQEESAAAQREATDSSESMSGVSQPWLRQLPAGEAEADGFVRSVNTRLERLRHAPASPEAVRQVYAVLAVSESAQFIEGSAADRQFAVADHLARLRSVAPLTAPKPAKSAGGAPADVTRQPVRRRLQDTRIYGRPGGLRRPAESDQLALEDVFPRAENGRFERFPNPRGLTYPAAGLARSLNAARVRNALLTDMGSASWLQRINRGWRQDPARLYNCLDTAASVLASWYGQPTMAAPVHAEPGVPLRVEQDGPTRVSRWLNAGWRTGQDWEAVAARVRDGGHGSSAIVVFRLPGGAVHAVNALNYDGRVVWADGQRGRTNESPLYQGESFMSIELDPEGRPIDRRPLLEEVTAQSRGVRPSPSQVDHAAAAAMDSERILDDLRDMRLDPPPQSGRPRLQADTFTSRPGPSRDLHTPVASTSSASQTRDGHGGVQSAGPVGGKYARMRTVAGHAGLIAHDVRGDGNCFYYSLASLMGWDQTQSLAEAAQSLRNHLADVLPDYWDEMQYHLVPMYADGLTPDPAEADRIAQKLADSPDGGYGVVVSAIAHDIRSSGSFANTGGDVAPILAARVFGLSLNVVEAASSAVHRIGDGPTELHLVRDDEALHWMPARPADPGWNLEQARAMLAAQSHAARNEVEASAQAEAPQRAARRLPSTPVAQAQGPQRAVRRLPSTPVAQSESGGHTQEQSRGTDTVRRPRVLPQLPVRETGTTQDPAQAEQDAAERAADFFNLTDSAASAARENRRRARDQRAAREASFGPLPMPPAPEGVATHTPSTAPAPADLTSGTHSTVGIGDASARAFTWSRPTAREVMKRAFRWWPVSELQRMLEDQDHGSSSFVTGLERPLHAVNHHGSVMWMDARAGTRVEQPDPTLSVASIDLNADGWLINPTAEVRRKRWEYQRLPGLLPRQEALRRLEAEFPRRTERLEHLLEGDDETGFLIPAGADETGVLIPAEAAEVLVPSGVAGTTELSEPPKVTEAAEVLVPSKVAEATELSEPPKVTEAAEVLVPSKVAEATELSEPPKVTEATDVQEPPKPEVVPPWYVGHGSGGMLGEFSVTDVKVSAVTKANEEWADEVVKALPDTVRSAVRSGIRRALLDMIAVNTPEDWYHLLVDGKTIEAAGQVVWLRPVVHNVQSVKPEEAADAVHNVQPVKPEEAADAVHNVQPVQQSVKPEKAADAVRKYGVKWSSTSGAQKHSHMSSRAAETALFSALMLSSAAASAFVLGAPRIVLEAGVERDSASRQTVISGRKLFVTSSTLFSSETRVLVFVDGIEQETGSKPAPVGLAIEFPSVFVDQGKRNLEPAQDSILDAGRTGTTSANQGAAFARPRMSEEVLNAIDVTPVVAALHRDLRSAGLDAAEVIAISHQVQEQLVNERTIRNRQAWQLGGGDVTNSIRIGSVPKWNGVIVHGRSRITLKAAQLVDVRDAVSTRADLGAGAARGYGRGGTSSAAMTFAANVTGLVDPLIDNHIVKGVAPYVSVSGNSHRRWNYGLTDTGLNHTVLVASGPMARYLATLEYTITWTSPTHRGLRSTSVEIPAELGVPWRGAAEFERRGLGRVASPVVQQGSLHDLATQVAAQPNVRALLQISGVRPDVSVVRPARLDIPRPRPAQDEPLHLALGGLGFGTAIGLPGAQLIEDYLLATLKGLAGKRAKVDWAAVERQLGVRVGRAVLEGDLDNVLAGMSFDISVGKKTVTVFLKGTLSTPRDSFTSENLTVNTRAAMTSALSSSSDSRRAVTVAGGAAARVSAAKWLRLQFGAVRLQAKFSGGKEQSLSDAVTGYRRKENLGLEHPPLVTTRDIVYEITVRTEDGRFDERVWLDRPGDLVAEIVTPRAFTPAQRVTREELADTGKTTFARKWPDRQETQIDFSTGSTGLYPAFVNMPALTGMVARTYFDLHGLRWTDDWTQWPSEIVDATRPARLEQFFGLLTDGLGREVRLPDHDGWETTLNLQMRAYAPRPLQLTKAKTEIEHYLKHQSKYGTAKAQSKSVSLQGSTSAMVRLGSDQGGSGIVLADHAEVRVAQPSHSQSRAPGGRLVALAHGDVGAEWGSTHEKTDGAIEISRGTYDSEAVAGYRSDPGFLATITRRRGGRTETSRRFVRVSGAMDLLVPNRRIEDLGLPGKATDPAQDLSAEGAKPVEDPSKRLTYLGDRLWTTSVWPEVLKADGVVPEIVQRLRERNILPLEKDKESIEQVRLRETVAAVFRSEALKSGHSALLGSGFGGWFPITERGGAVRYVWINVFAEGLDPAHAQRDRAEITLTLRSEGVTEVKDVGKQGVSASVGVTVSGRAGDHQAVTNQQGHGGIEYSRGSDWQRGQTNTSVKKSTQIYRANTKDGSVEFEHRMHFRVQLGMTLKMPEFLRPFVHYGYVLYNVIGNALADAPRAGTVTQEPTPWTWYDNGMGAGRTVPGEVRFLIPQHLTVPAPAVGPMPAPFERTWGENARWLRLPSADLPPALDAALVEHLHPWDVPAAGALQQWVKTAARQSGSAADLVSSRIQGLPRPDFTSLSGLAHQAQTSQDMVRANIKDLLKDAYIVDAGGTKVRVGLELVRAEEFEPTPRMKGRGYTQDNHDIERGVEWSSGRLQGGGLDGGGGSDHSAVLAHAVGDRSERDSSRFEGGASETYENNREATREFRYYRIDVRMIARPVENAAYALSVDVPGGLYAMLPLKSSGALAEDLATPLARILVPATEPPKDLTSEVETPPADKLTTIPEEPEPASRREAAPVEETPVPEHLDTEVQKGSRWKGKQRATDAASEDDWRWEGRERETDEVSEEGSLREDEDWETDDASHDDSLIILVRSRLEQMLGETGSVLSDEQIREEAARQAGADGAPATFADTVLLARQVVEALLESPLLAREVARYEQRVARTGDRASDAARPSTRSTGTGQSAAMQAFLDAPRGLHRRVAESARNRQNLPGDRTVAGVAQRGSDRPVHTRAEAITREEGVVTDTAPAATTTRNGPEEARREVPVLVDEGPVLTPVEVLEKGAPSQGPTPEVVVEDAAGGQAEHLAAQPNSSTSGGRTLVGGAPPAEETMEVPVPAPGMRLSVEAIKHPARFTAEEITGLSAAQAEEIQGMDTTSRETALGLAAQRAADAILWTVAQDSGRSMTNTDVLLTLPGPESGALAIWISISQLIANRLRHRVKALIGSEAVNPVEICPQ